jgi:hypothetical protein
MWGMAAGSPIPGGSTLTDEDLARLNETWKGLLIHWREVRRAPSSPYGEWVTNDDSREVLRRDWWRMRRKIADSTYYWQWRNQFVEGPPKATHKYTSAALARMGMIGLYRKPEES